MTNPGAFSLSDIAEVAFLMSGVSIKEEDVSSFLNYLDVVELTDESMVYVDTLIDSEDGVETAWLLIRSYLSIVKPDTILTKSSYVVNGVTYNIDYATSTMSRGNDAFIQIEDKLSKSFWFSAVKGEVSMGRVVDVYNETAYQYNIGIYHQPLTLLKRLSRNQRLFRHYILNDELLKNFEKVPIMLLQHITGVKLYTKRELYTLLFEESDTILPLTRKYKMLIEKMK